MVSGIKTLSRILDLWLQIRAIHKYLNTVWTVLEEENKKTGTLIRKSYRINMYTFVKYQTKRNYPIIQFFNCGVDLLPTTSIYCLALSAFFHFNKLAPKWEKNGQQKQYLRSCCFLFKIWWTIRDFFIVWLFLDFHSFFRSLTEIKKS